MGFIQKKMGTTQPSEYHFAKDSAKLIRQGLDPRLPITNIRKLQVVDYRGPAPPGTLNLLFALPTPDSDMGHIDEADKATKRELDRIRDECEVFMEVREDYIVISASLVTRLQKALQRIRDLLRANARDLMCTTVALVDRSTTATDSSILLKPTSQLRGLGSGAGWRGIARPQSLIQIAADCEEDLVPLTEQGLAKAIVQAAHAICPVLGELRMRVHLGILALTKKKDLVEYRTTGDFETLVENAAGRGLTCFGHRLGDEKLISRILDHIYSTEEKDPMSPKFIADDYSLESLREVKPKYCLVFFSGNHRIEIDVQEDQAGIYPPTASAPRVYKLFKKSLVAEVAVACPDKKFDWHLSVESDIGADMVAEKFRMLARALVFVRGPKGHFEFPITRVPRAALRDAHIDNVACKVYWKFGCGKSPYSVEVAVYHDWETSPLRNVLQKPIPQAASSVTFDTTGVDSPRPVKSCAMALYRYDWDDKMRDINPTSRKFTNEFADLFSDQGDLLSGIRQLLEEVDYLLNTATTEAGGPEQP